MTWHIHFTPGTTSYTILTAKEPKPVLVFSEIVLTIMETPGRIEMILQGHCKCILLQKNRQILQL